MHGRAPPEDTYVFTSSNVFDLVDAWTMVLFRGYPNMPPPVLLPRGVRDGGYGMRARPVHTAVPGGFLLGVQNHPPEHRE